MESKDHIEFKRWVAGVGIGELLDDLRKAEEDTRFLRVALACSVILNALLIFKFVWL